MRARWSWGVAFAGFVTGYFLGLVALTYINH